MMEASLALTDYFRSRAGERAQYGRVLGIAGSTWLIVALGVCFSILFVAPKQHGKFSGFVFTQPPASMLNGFASWDGAWYTEIAAKGYRYEPGLGSHVVFFPLFPALGASVSRSFQLSPELALLLISNVCFVASLWMLRQHMLQYSRPMSQVHCDCALLICCLLPASFFFRIAYSESLFLLVTLLIVTGMKNGWSDWWLAILVGAATGIRAVGVAMVVVFAHYLWTRRQAGRNADTSNSGDPQATNARNVAGWIRGASTLALLAVSCWGMLAFMAHLWVEFDDPLAWYSNQATYNVHPHSAAGDKILSLVSLKPIWSVYLPGTYASWARRPSWTAPFWSLRFVNPVYFMITCGLISYGWWSRILERRDVLVGALLLAVPYLTKGHDNDMLGFARYCSVVYPAYIVAAHILLRIPRPLAVAGLGFSAVLMSFYSSLFAAWYDFI